MLIYYVISKALVNSELGAVKFWESRVTHGFLTVLGGLVPQSLWSKNTRKKHLYSIRLGLTQYNCVVFGMRLAFDL